MVSAEPAIAWLLDEAPKERFLEDVFTGVCARLRDGGLPLDRATLHIRALHPQFAGVGLRWHAGDERAVLLRVSGAVFGTPAFLNSPVRALFEGAEGLRQRLDVPLADDTFTIYHDLRQDGFSDYVALPLPLSGGQRIGSSWATRRAGGWRTEELIEIDRLRPVLAMAAEIRIARRIGRNIAETYLGCRASDRVLDGNIRRGDIERIEAALLYVDMRGYSSLTERLDSAQVFDRLNRFFDAFGAPVESSGGEILKFMGDGMLAVFPVEAGALDAAARAFDAALDGLAGLERVNEALGNAGDEPIRCGVGLHVGDVAFGNFGTESRLDFTVVGPAVNLAARLQQLTRDVDEPFLLSREAAAEAGRPTRALGAYPLRGLAAPVAVFAPAATDGDP